MAVSSLVLFQNVGLSDSDTGIQTSSVGEPSLANNGQQILLTGNWFASRSFDHGATWDHISPFNFLPPVDDGFCCDQTVIYDPSRDITIWLLQYIKKNNTNTLRVAVKVGPTLGNSAWQWHDLRPKDVNSNWKKEWFDYNHAALSNDFLYVGTNAFSTIGSGTFTRAVIFRLPLDQLASGGNLTYSYFDTNTNGSLRCVQGARDTMYFASHNTNSEIRVFKWPENSTSVSEININVSPWNDGAYVAKDPKGKNWLTRCDARITGGWVGNGIIGFMWSVNRQGSDRPFPYVRVVRLDEPTQNLIDEPDIWNKKFAYAYPDASTNDRGHVGISLFRGGGTHYPDHVVGILDDFSKKWSLKVTKEGTHGPKDSKWGDYVTCRRHSPDGLTWIASGFTLQGGNNQNNIEPRFVHFGRERDQAAVNRWQNS